MHLIFNNIEDMSIILHNNNTLLKHRLNLKFNSLKLNYSKQVCREITGYDIFHISYKINKIVNNYKICFKDYILLCKNYMHKLWNIETANDFIINKQKYEHFIISENINLDKTLFIHIKCTDNIIPNKIIYNKYNIYPNWLYFELCKIYNYNTICILTDNPNNIIIKNIENIAIEKNIKVYNLSRLTNNFKLEIYFLINAINILVDNSTFTFMMAMHTNIHLFNEKKNIFFYEDFFTKFLRDINTTAWDKNILDFCIIQNNIFTSNEKQITTSKITIKKLSLKTYKCKCKSIFIKHNDMYKYMNLFLNNIDINIFSYNNNNNNNIIKIGDWIGNKTQIKSLLI